MLIDSHCHLDRLDLSPFGQNFDLCMQDTVTAGIDHMLCVAIDLESYPAMRSLVDGHDNISVSVGVHPNEDSGREPGIDELIELAKDPKVVAIGETGLDYYRSEGSTLWQQERFRNHIRAAKSAGKPLIIHTREARADTIRILQEENASEVGGVIHCFTEDWETARQALNLGFYISFSGILTFKNATIIQDAAAKVPEDHLLIETDSPYLAPNPFRGKPNYPKHVHHVAKFLAEIRKVSFDEIANITSRNYHNLFRPTH